MKKSITFLFVLCNALCFAQGIRFLQGNTDVTGTTVTEKITATYHLTQFRLYNSTNEDKKFVFSRIVKSNLLADYRFAGTLHCSQYPPLEDSIFTFTDTVKIKAHQYLPESINACSGLDVYLFMDGVCREYRVSFIAQEVGGSSTISEVTIHYVCPNGITDYPSIATLTTAYPNPAASVATIDYTLNSSNGNPTLVLYDVTGRALQTRPLTQKQGKVEISTVELPSGLYFCRLIINDKPVHTTKLIVSHE